jgi:hypothetical protein
MAQTQQELERKLAQAKRLSSVLNDATTEQRLAELRTEIVQRLEEMDRRRRCIAEGQIQARAFDLWRQHGCPAGRDKEFWYRAERELIEDDSSSWFFA